MASIVKRSSGYYVVYYYHNERNEKKQKWESGFTYEQAVARKRHLEQASAPVDLTRIPAHPSVAQFIDLWLPAHAKANWQYTTYTTSLACVQNHILPYIGTMRLDAVQPYHTEMLFSTLHGKFAKKASDKSQDKYLSTTTLRLIYVLLKQSFEKAVEWGFISRNPVQCKAPKPSGFSYEIWPAEAFSHALEKIENPLLHLAVHLAFVCSLRRGEIFGLTLDDINFEERTIRITKTLQRVEKSALEIIPHRSIVRIYPAKTTGSKSTLIMKKPKTDTSCRKVFMTESLMDEIKIRLEQKETDRINFGWQENDLLFCYQADGTPIDPTRCLRWFQNWQRAQQDFPYPYIPFHAIRHSSATYKLLLSQGDYKSVQGDTGHKTANVLLNIYAKTQDEQRKRLITRLEETFYA